LLGFSLLQKHGQYYTGTPGRPHRGGQAAIAKLGGQPFGGRRLTVNVANPQAAGSGGSRSSGTRFGGARGAARRPVRW
jgi:hypothetical protein